MYNKLNILIYVNDVFLIGSDELFLYKIYFNLFKYIILGYNLKEY